MKLINWALEQNERRVTSCCESLALLFPQHVFETHGDPYLRRVYLLRRKNLLAVGKKLLPPSLYRRLEKVAPSMYLHYFYRGDSDTELHNHPWGISFSFILTNGYWESRWRPHGVEDQEKRPGDINVLRAYDFHRVTLRDKTKGAWSLFVSGPRVQDWGFWSPSNGDYTPWRTFVDERQTPHEQALN